jgi:hypothetical protein
MKTLTMTLIRASLRVIVWYLIGALLVGCVSAIPSTGSDLKLWLEQPFVLLFVMYLGAIGSGLKAISSAQRDGAVITFPQYLAHWPETASAAIAVPLVWGFLLLTNQLNFAAALAFGAVANTAVDAIRRNGRSASLMTRAPFVVLGALVLMSFSGCAGMRALYEKPATPPQYAKAVLIHHNAIGESIARLREDPAVSASTKAQLLAAYRVTVCSDAEMRASTSLAACADGPAERLERAARAYELLANAKTETELQSAVDALVSLLVPLIETIARGSK